MDLSRAVFVGLSLCFIASSGTSVDAFCDPSSTFQCQNGSCIPRNYQCDHQNDCPYPDGSDEEGCAPEVDSSMALLWSSKDSSTGLGTLGLLYGDLDVCIEQTYTQAQTIATINASCNLREFKMRDLTSSFDSLEVVYFSKILVSFNKAKQSVDVDPYPLRFMTSDPTSVSLSPVSDQVTGLSLDWVSMLLYLSDAGYQRITLGDASDTNPIWWRPAVDTNITSPQDVAIHPGQSYLFWIDLDINPKIERLDLVNEIREVLISNGTILSPTKLAIDFKSDRLYWLDSNMATIGSCNLDGSNVSLWRLDLFSTISAFTFYRKYLFLGDRNRNLIHAFNESRHQVVSNLLPFTNEQGIIDMATYDSSKDPTQTTIQSPCMPSKGGCSHFCITVNATAKKCLCAIGFFLGSDGISCVTRPFQDQFLIISDIQQRQLFQVDIATAEVRATIAVDSNTSPTAVEYDYVSNNVFWFDNITKTIKQTILKSGVTSNLADSSGNEVTSLAVDTVNRDLYYTYYSTGIIGVVSLTTSDSRTILAEPDSRPRVVILDIDGSALYWSDCGKRSIETAQIDTPTVHQSIVSKLAFCVLGLAIESTNEVFYWLDAGGNIESAKLDGSKRRLIHSDSSAGYIAMTIDDDYLYLADNNLRQIFKLDRSTNKIDSLTPHIFVKPYALIRSSSGSNQTSVSRTVRPTSTSTSPGGDSKTTTIILVVVICGSVVLIAVAVVVGILVAKWIKRRKSGVKSDGYDNVIPHSNGESQHEMYTELGDGYDTIKSQYAPQSDSEKQDETYTELDELPDPTYDLEIDNIPQYDELNETTEPNRQSGIDNDYI